VKKRIYIASSAVIWTFILVLAGVWYLVQNEPTAVVAQDSQCKNIDQLYCGEKPVDNKLIEPSKDAKVATAVGMKGVAAKANSSGGTYVYKIETRGAVRTNKSAFAAKVAETLNSPRGWGQKASFREGDSGSFVIVLTPAANVPSFSGACSSAWSCRVGKYVIINEDRWLGATASWNGAGGSLRDYQHMVVNHEVGHWLGHGHASCGGAGKLAPLMQQQSISLQGCKFNPWPLPSELGVL
jgi:hypothetical protein